MQGDVSAHIGKRAARQPRLHLASRAGALPEPDDSGYVSDVRTAMTEAKQAAGDKNVLVHGAGTAQLALAAGVAHMHYRVQR